MMQPTLYPVANSTDEIDVLITTLKGDALDWNDSLNLNLVLRISDTTDATDSNLTLKLYVGEQVVTIADALAVDHTAGTVYDFANIVMQRSNDVYYVHGANSVSVLTPADITADAELKITATFADADALI